MITQLDRIEEPRQRSNLAACVDVLAGLQLTRRFGEINPQLQERVRGLSIAQLGELGEALLDFEIVADLAGWLNQHQPQE